MGKIYKEVIILFNDLIKCKSIVCVTLLLLILPAFPIFAQTTSWKGTSGTDWNTSANWTNGIPNASVDAVVGDINFTGSNNPVVSTSVNVKSLTLGDAVPATLTLSNSNSHLTATGSLAIQSNGTLKHVSSTVKVAGNWTNSGSYQPSVAITGKKITPTVIFTGITQSLSGSASFMNLTINQGSTTTLNNAISVTKNFSISGTFDPGIYLVTLSGATFTMGATGVAKVKAATFANNYSLSPSTVNTGYTIDFAATDRAQTIAAFSISKPYSCLVISGGTTKTLTSAINFSAATSEDGKLIIGNGILDLATFTANRATTTAGGTLSIANGATLNIGGANTFPANFVTRTLGLTSTVEYNGAGQTISNQLYGNLTLSAGSGSVVKTMPATALTIAGNLTSSIGTGATLNFTANQNITVNGNMVLGTGTTFNAASFTHNLDGNLMNNGTFNGGTSSVTFRGIAKTIDGTSHSVFHNLSVTGTIQAKAAQVTVSGSLTTSGAGTLRHAAEVNSIATAGTLTMSGTAQTISGLEITFDNLTISGTVNSSSDLAITGNLNVSNTGANAFNLTGGTIHLSGAGKTIITGSAASLNVNALRITGAISTSNSFSIKSNFSGFGTFTATAGTIHFIGSSTFGGTHKFYDVTLNGTLLQLVANSNLGIANLFTLTSGTFDVSTTSPNTVTYNGTNQNITTTTYHNLSLSGSGNKTGINHLTLKGNLTIGSGVTFAAGSYTYTVEGNWINNGTFTAGTSTVQFAGSLDSQLSGATIFSVLTLSKSSAIILLTLNSAVTAATVNMDLGEMRTGSNAITITNTRTGSGIIMGTIIRDHAFNANTTYAFEGAFNTIMFGTVSNISSVTVTVASGSVSGFPFGGAVNKVYTVNIPNGSYTNATIRLHYTENELNGNTEESLNLWHNAGSWASAGKSALSMTDNWAEKSALSSITGQWTLSDDNTVLAWTGATSTDWHTASNWSVLQGSTTGRVPLSTDIAEIGSVSFTNQPVISSPVNVKSIQLGSAQDVTLTLSGGNLTVAGNVTGAWTGNAAHTLAIGNQTLQVGGDLNLSDGIAGHIINVTVGSGTVTVAQTLNQSGNASFSFSGGGNLNLGNDFVYTNGTFSPGAATVTYNGSANQVVAGNISYHNLVIDKTNGTATSGAPTTITGNLTLATGGTFVTSSNLSIAGNVLIGTGTSFNSGASIHAIGGDWTLNGSYIPGSGSIKFNGAGDQNIMASTFNNLTISKSSGTAHLTGNITLNAALTVEAGSFNLGSYTLARSAAGGAFTLRAGTNLYVSGTNNYPVNFNNHVLESTSTVYYNGTGIQNLAKVSYGNLILQNGGMDAKKLTGPTTIKGDLTISTGATLKGESYSLISLGNVVNNGTFEAGTGMVFLDGTGKTTDGAWIFNDLTINGSYSRNSGSFTVNNNFYNAGSFAGNTFPSTYSGDYTNVGTLSTSGMSTFTGNRVQTIRILGTSSSTAAGSVYFNGTVAPILNSNANPTYVSVYINNTAGISSSTGWTVHRLFKVASGSSFNGGSATHTFNGSFENEGTVTSSGVLRFSPGSAATLALGSNFNSTGIVRFGGSGQITLASSPGSFTNLEISNKNAVGINPPVGLNILGDLKIEPGSLFNAGPGLSHTLNGHLVNEGTLQGGTSTFTFATNTTSSEISGGGVTNFHHVVINDSTTISTNIKIKGDFINNGVLDVNSYTLEFDGNNAQTIGGTAPSNFYNLTVSNNVAPLNASTNLNVSNTLMLGAGAVFKPGEAVIINSTVTEGMVSGTGTLEVTRTLSPADYTDQYKFSTYDLGKLTIKFSGTVAQTSSLTSFNNLTINNPAGFTLGGNTIVTGILRLEDGNISTNGNILTLGTSINNPGTVEVIGTGMILGKLKRWVTNSSGFDIIFPVGNAGIRRNATINYTTAPSGGTLTAEFISDSPGTSGLPLTEPNGSEADIVVNKVATSGYWTITAGTGVEALTGGIYNATLEATSFAGINNLESFVLLKRSDNTQPWGLNGTHVTAGGSSVSPVLMRTGLSGFSDFAVGGRENTTLPVTLIYFRALKKGNTAVLTWKTATEMNSKGFSVEVSSDAKVYRPLGFLKSGEANSLTAQQYSFTDTEGSKSGVRYYRLRQQDLDGKTAYYGPRALTFNPEMNMLTAYPNPFTADFEITLNSAAFQSAIFILYDVNGREIWKTNKEVPKGNSHLKLNIPPNLRKGIYYIKVHLDQTSQSVKVVKY